MIVNVFINEQITTFENRHLNLLLPQGSSSSALLHYQATKNARSRLNTRTKNWNG